eukprot:m.232472 g.232472  ORF g.232472 m.232472 type:complete len:375 (+) comp18730_c0_seq1:1-1125(+)
MMALRALRLGVRAMSTVAAEAPVVLSEAKQQLNAALQERAKFLGMLEKHRLSSLIGRETELFHMIYGKKVPTPANPMTAIKEEDVAHFVKYMMPSLLKESDLQRLPRRVPFSDLDSKDPATQPDFRPKSPAFFSGRSAFQDQLTIFEPILANLNAAQERFEVTGSSTIGTEETEAAPAAPPQWVTKPDLELMLGRLYDDEYTELCDIFTQLWLHPRGGERVRKLVSPYLRFAVGAEHVPPKGKVDEQGRGFGLGYRKTCTAQVWVTPGTGLFTINGEPLAEALSTAALRFHAFEPLRAAGALGLFDVAATVEGGGPTGVAGAVRLGLAKGLAALVPEYEKPLNDAGMLTRDTRIVERKKPGQKKARKKFQWVKR